MEGGLELEEEWMKKVGRSCSLDGLFREHIVIFYLHDICWWQFWRRILREILFKIFGNLKCSRMEKQNVNLGSNCGKRLSADVKINIHTHVHTQGRSLLSFHLFPKPCPCGLRMRSTSVLLGEKDLVDTSSACWSVKKKAENMMQQDIVTIVRKTKMIVNVIKTKSCSQNCEGKLC